MRLAIQKQAMLRWLLMVGLLIAWSLFRNASAPFQWSFGISLALLFLSAFFWPRCPHCGARVVQFNKREWVPDEACWRCHRPYDEVETPAYSIALTDAVTEALKLKKKDPEASERMLAEAEKAHEAAFERELTMLRERADHDPLAARTLQSRLKQQLRGLALVRKVQEQGRRTDPDFDRELRNIQASEKTLSDELARVEARLKLLSASGSER